MTAPTTTVPPQQGGLSPAQIAALLALVQAQAAVRQRITDTAVAAALQALEQFTGWWSDVQVKAVMTRVLRIVQPSQRQAATITDAYLTRAASIMTGKRLTPAGAADVTKLRTDITPAVARDILNGKIKVPWVELGNPVDGPSRHIDAPAPMALRPDRSPRRVPGRDSGMAPPPPEPARTTRTLNPLVPYERIAEQYRYQVVAEGVPEDKARQRALVKLALAAETDVTLAVREQYHKTMGKHRADGYRRILHPELSKSGPCGLCVVAADRTYRVADLLPIHNRCVCEVLPIYGNLDPGVFLNNSDLQALYGEAGSTGGSKRERGALKKIRVGFDDTGSPLANADQKTKMRAQLDQLERSYETLLHRSMRGENLPKSLDSQAARITQLRDELGLGPSSVAPRVETPKPTRDNNPMKKMRVVLTENGETGPVLIDGSQKYRGPADVAKTQVPDRKVRAKAQLTALEKTYQGLQARAKAGENLDKPLQWQSDAIAKLRKELGLQTV